MAFHEKRSDAPCIPGDPERVYASMGNYLFSARTLLRELHTDAAREEGSHDFGRDILPSLVARADVFAYDFQTNVIPGEDPSVAAYWRDVGTLDAYYEANMDLRSVSPSLNLYNREWPLRTASYADPPAKFTFDEEQRRGHAIDSIASGGCILAGGTVRNSVLSRWVRVESGALVEDSVILDNCVIGRDARVRRAILDKNVHVADGATLGYDLDEDRRRHHVTESGIVVVEGLRSSLEISTIVV
jgi:glucose-1-phosphate adenylyltransferase